MSSSSSSCPSPANDVTVSISDAFDGGNITLLEPPTTTTTTTATASDEDGTSSSSSSAAVVVVKLAIKPDPYTELEETRHMQYFAFRATVVGAGGLSSSSSPSSSSPPLRVKYVIENAGDASYPVAWKGTTVCYNADLGDDDGWRRNTGTRYRDGTLTWEHVHDEGGGSVYFSYFPPYSYSRHLDLVARCAKQNGGSAGARVRSLGRTLQGREIDCVEAGTGKLQCWIVHRQHPGETQAEYYAEGLLGRLLGWDASDGVLDDVAKEVLGEYTLRIVPCMCLDGAVLGHLRTNSAGANLNREWTTVRGEYAAPSLERSPEVYHVLRAMDETGVDVFLDVHGDEELPYNFISGAEHTPRWGERLRNLHGAFVASYARSNDDMQAVIGYPPPRSPAEALPYLNVAANQAATRFDCLSLTLEMPFKDCASNPDPERGWSPARCKRLGSSVLEPLAYVRPHLRTEGRTSSSPHAFGDDDKYVEPHDDFVSHEWENEGFKPLRRMYSDHYSAEREKAAAAKAKAKAKAKGEEEEEEGKK